MPRNGVRALVGIGLLVSLLLAGAASFYASSAPDGLEKVAGDVGILDHARRSATAGSPLADYGVDGVSDPRLSVGLAGIIGVLATAAVAFALFRRLARHDRPGVAEAVAAAPGRP